MDTQLEQPAGVSDRLQLRRYLRANATQLGIIAVFLVVAGTIAGILFVLSDLEEDPLITTEGDLVIIRCRKTCTATIPRRSDNPCPDLVPLYFAQWQMREDRTVIDSVNGISTPMDPGIVRVFRKPGKDQSGL